jgi:hypothetical protein
MKGDQLGEFAYFWAIYLFFNSANYDLSGSIYSVFELLVGLVKFMLLREPALRDTIVDVLTELVNVVQPVSES